MVVASQNGNTCDEGLVPAFWEPVWVYGHDRSGVWFLSNLLFSLLHLPDAFFGIGSLAILRVVVQFGLKSVYYWRY